MQTSEGIRAVADADCGAGGRGIAAGLLASGLAAALLAAVAVGAPPAHAAQQEQRSTQVDLDLLRQFHSYAPARRVERKHVADKQARTRAALMRKARAAARVGNYKAARKLFARALDAGEITAAWYLGYLHRTGRGGKVDHAKAFAYYRMLAKRYDPDERNMRRLMLSVDALVRVADYYRTGVGKKREKRDLRRAFRLYSMAAAHNHAGAYYGMAKITLASKGRIGRKRWVIGWLKRAAMGGHAAAARKLSVLAANGMKGIIRPDPVAAQAWRIIALRLSGPRVAGGQASRGAAATPALANALSEEQRQLALRLADDFLRAMSRSRGRIAAPVATPAPPPPLRAAVPGAAAAPASE